MDEPYMEDRALPKSVWTGRYHNLSFDLDRSSNARSSVESPTFGRLRKRKSGNNIRGSSLSQVLLAQSPQPTPTASPAEAVKKRPFRKAVRKLFGRKARDPVQEAHHQDHEPPPSRHGYHRSDPGHLLRQQPQRAVEDPVFHDTFSPQDYSFPPTFLDTSPNVRSPHAVEFPKSARLKPLDLGNPFYTRPPGPKRRATLPSFDLAESATADDCKAVAASNIREARTSLDIPPAIPESEIGLAVTTEKRRSRSANDLRQAMSDAERQRGRNEEIRFWRESYIGLGSVVQSFGKEDMYAPGEEQSADADAIGRPLKDSAQSHREEFPESPVVPLTSRSLEASSINAPRPATAIGDNSQDLESRVAKLESGLHDFQRSLHRLTAASRGDTYASRSVSHERPRAPRRQHTPSILVDTLRDPSWRPESLEGPSFNVDEMHYDETADAIDRSWAHEHVQTHLPHTPPTPSDRSRKADHRDERTFTLLYDLLEDERSARRTLEHQVQLLQSEVDSMATRITRGSWTNFSQPIMPHRPRTPVSSHGFGPPLFAAPTSAPMNQHVHSMMSHDTHLASRFSGTEESANTAASEIYGLVSSAEMSRRLSGQRNSVPPSAELSRCEDELVTPYEMYHTPSMEVKRASSYGFGGDGMF